MKERIKKIPRYPFIRRLYHFLRWGFFTLRYYWIEYSHRASVAWSHKKGVANFKRNPELIVSLTTIPERIGKVALCIDSLLCQSLKPDRLILWLSESNDLQRPYINVDSLPPELVKLKRRGLEIRWCEDIRSYRKIIPALRTFPQALIVTADDDIFYPRNWLKDLYEAYQREPQYIHCHRAHLIKYDSAGFALPYNDWDYQSPGYQGPSFALFPTSGAGVLYAPSHLPPETLNEITFLNMCPIADDVWLKAMTLMVGTSCKKLTPESFPLIELKISNNTTLSSENVILRKNDLQIMAVANHYGVFRNLPEQP